MAPALSPSPAAAVRRPSVRITYDVDEAPERWLLDEDDMPESTLHDQVLDLLKLILLAWVARWCPDLPGEARASGWPCPRKQPEIHFTER